MKIILSLISILFISLLKYSKSLTKIIFIMKEFGNTDSSCRNDHGMYTFYLYGNFDQDFNTKEKITIKLEYPDTEIECTPFSKAYYSKDSFKCEIDICEFPLDENVVLSPIEPKSNSFEFPNWKSFMSEIPGVSNKINSINPYCHPSFKTSFVTEDIKSMGCEKAKNKFVVNGYWDNIDFVTFKEEKFNMPLIDQDGKKALCNFKKIEEVECLFDGYGKIKFNSFYFKSRLSTYKVLSLDKSINVTECLYGQYINKMSIVLLQVFTFCLFLL